MCDPERSSLGDFLLGDWVVQPLLRRITNGDHVKRLEPRYMDLLVFLARHPKVVHSRERLIEMVWRVEAVAENTLTHAIAELRRALGDDARNPRYIETIYRGGYRLLIRPGPVDGDGTNDERSPVDEPFHGRFAARTRDASAADVPRFPVIRGVDETRDGELRIVMAPPDRQTLQGIDRVSGPTEVVVRICIEVPEGPQKDAGREDPPRFPWQEKIS